MIAERTRMELPLHIRVLDLQRAIVGGRRAIDQHAHAMRRVDAFAGAAQRGQRQRQFVGPPALLRISARTAHPRSPHQLRSDQREAEFAHIAASAQRLRAARTGTIDLDHDLGSARGRQRQAQIDVLRSGNRLLVQRVAIHAHAEGGGRWRLREQAAQPQVAAETRPRQQ